MMADWELTDPEILQACGPHRVSLLMGRGVAKAAQGKLMQYLDGRKRNTYLPLEDPCEWVAFPRDYWQALRKALEVKDG